MVHHAPVTSPCGTAMDPPPNQIIAGPVQFRGGFGVTANGPDAPPPKGNPDRPFQIAAPRPEMRYNRMEIIHVKI